MLFQILMNLVENSACNTQQGFIVVEVSEVENFEDIIKIEVKDTGAGIANLEYCHSLMKARTSELLYHQERSLGLKIAHRLTGCLGPFFCLRIKSKVGVGTVATFYIRQ